MQAKKQQEPRRLGRIELGQKERCGMKLELTEQGGMRPEQMKPEQMKLEQMKLEQMRQGGMRPAQTKLELTE